jgi:hypothetical protein
VLFRSSGNDSSTTASGGDSSDSEDEGPKQLRSDPLAKQDPPKPAHDENLRDSRDENAKDSENINNYKPGKIDDSTFINYSEMIDKNFPTFNHLLPQK